MYRASKKWPYHLSSGCVVLRKTNDGVEVLLLHRDDTFAEKDHDSYHLPKGTVEEGEALEQTAIREVREETNQPVAIKGYLGGVHGQFTNPYTNEFWDRIVHYFVAVPTSDATLQTDGEHAEAIWMDVDRALTALTSNPKQEKMILERALEFVATFKDQL